MSSGHRYVVRNLLAPYPITGLARGGHLTVTAPSEPWAAIDLAGAGGVAFVQAATEPERPVLQAARVQGPPILSTRPTTLHMLADPDAPAPRCEGWPSKSGARRA